MEEHDKRQMRACQQAKEDLKKIALGLETVQKATVVKVDTVDLWLDVLALVRIVGLQIWDAAAEAGVEEGMVEKHFREKGLISPQDVL